ncbi:GNAT family N-acyltransferase [Nonomuraea sp. NPDC046802]|uniref:GNAT family N-acyltransferase n=1 Tax=Nonomuraea sp. NPDC046802 TaxID=3154919 RepID=UPI0033C99615
MTDNQVRERSPLRELQLEIYPPADGPDSFDRYPWQREIRSFRGEVIYQNGRFPHFRLADGAFDDADEHDVHAYHLVVRSRSTGAIVATARAAPLERLPVSRVLALDEPTATRLMSSRGLRRSEVFEGARWVVDPRHRGRRIGQLLIVAGALLTRRAHRKLIWVLAGTATGQDALLRQFGFQEVSATPHPMPDVGDTVKLLACAPEQLLDHRPEFVEEIAPAVSAALRRH